MKQNKWQKLTDEDWTLFGMPTCYRRKEHVAHCGCWVCVAEDGGALRVTRNGRKSERRIYHVDNLDGHYQYFLDKKFYQNMLNKKFLGEDS